MIGSSGGFFASRLPAVLPLTDNAFLFAQVTKIYIRFVRVVKSFNWAKPPFSGLPFLPSCRAIRPPAAPGAQGPAGLGGDQQRQGSGRVPHRAHAPVGSRDLRGCHGRPPPPLCPDAGGAGARLPSQRLLFQRGRRPMRAVRGARPTPVNRSVHHQRKWGERASS